MTRTSPARGVYPFDRHKLENVSFTVVLLRKTSHPAAWYFGIASAFSLSPITFLRHECSRLPSTLSRSVECYIA
jgi:hypothetical protein